MNKPFLTNFFENIGKKSNKHHNSNLLWNKSKLTSKLNNKRNENYYDQQNVPVYGDYQYNNNYEQQQAVYLPQPQQSLYQSDLPPSFEYQTMHSPQLNENQQQQIQVPQIPVQEQNTVQYGFKNMQINSVNIEDTNKMENQMNNRNDTSTDSNVSDNKKENDTTNSNDLVVPYSENSKSNESFDGDDNLSIVNAKNTDFTNKMKERQNQFDFMNEYEKRILYQKLYNLQTDKLDRLRRRNSVSRSEKTKKQVSVYKGKNNNVVKNDENDKVGSEMTDDDITENSTMSSKQQHIHLNKNKNVVDNKKNIEITNTLSCYGMNKKTYEEENDDDTDTVAVEDDDEDGTSTSSSSSIKRRHKVSGASKNIKKSKIDIKKKIQTGKNVKTAYNIFKTIASTTLKHTTSIIGVCAVLKLMGYDLTPYMSIAGNMYSYIVPNINLQSILPGKIFSGVHTASSYLPTTLHMPNISRDNVEFIKNYLVPSKIF